MPWLKANGFGDYVKTEESAKWGELKKGLAFVGSFATEEQLRAAASFMLGTLRATREQEAPHE